MRVDAGRRLEPSPWLSERLKAASVVVFAATPKDQDRFFWSPQRPKVSCAMRRIGGREWRRFGCSVICALFFRFLVQVGEEEGG